MAKKRFFSGTLAMVLALVFGLVLAGCDSTGGGDVGDFTVKRIRYRENVSGHKAFLIDFSGSCTVNGSHDNGDYTGGAHGFTITDHGSPVSISSIHWGDSASAAVWLYVDSYTGSGTGAVVTYTPTSSLAIKNLDGSVSLEGFTKTVIDG